MDSEKIGNSAEYGFDKIVPMENSPLAGTEICILGSSVAFGATAEECAVGEYLAARFGTKLTKEAVSGTTLMDIEEKSYIQRLKRNIPTESDFSLFICQLSTNDTRESLNFPLGEIAESRELEAFDTHTITGAIEYIICYAKKHWNCPIVFFTGSRFEREKYGKMVTRLLELKEKWGIGVLDLWSDDGFNAISEAQRKLYMSDPVHPMKAGYRDWWGPEMERQLLQYLGF